MPPSLGNTTIRLPLNDCQHKTGAVFFRQRVSSRIDRLQSLQDGHLRQVEGVFTYCVSQRKGGLQTIYRRFIDEGLIRPIFAMGKEPRLEPIPGIATLEDLTLTPDQRKLADFMVSNWSMLRPYALPPGTPPDRLKVLREAYRKAMKSPQLIKDANAMG